MTQTTFQSRYDNLPETLNWGRVAGIAFAITVEAALFMMLLVPPAAPEQDKDQSQKTNATIIEPPPKPPPPPPPPPEQVKAPPPKEVPPPPQRNIPPPPPTPPVVTDTPNFMSKEAPPPAPPAPPVAAQTVEAAVDIAWKLKHMPDFPREELNNGESCSLVLLVSVNEDGEPTGVNTEKGCHNTHFERAAKDAAMKWRFTPKMENGRRVPSTARVPVDFTNPNQ